MLAELSPALIAEVERAAKLLASTQRICVLTGAGISAESGIPTFRDKQTGLWENYAAEDLATPEAFDRDPKLVWSWYQWRRQLVADKKPNPAHDALAQWQQYAAKRRQHLTLITQNVDDLHEQAGSTVTHLHGNIWQNRCSQCKTPYNNDSGIVDNSKREVSFNEDLLTCQHCDGYIRPDIVWFGEALPVEAWQTAEDAAANCEAFISIGTSSLVYPAAGLAQLAKQNGAKIIEINPHPTPNTIVDITLVEKAGVVMPLLTQKILI
ncbi:MULTISPECIES: NAD-dependent deacylase [unclassified Psychrobacter]|uniref:NAD-dependent deacylase n=1 Tax=unclassified Psychrobacter TaxID=196806 RepID=UPI0025D31931|nr:MULTISPECIES: NAD-dependent deacylase [unclassified Psychrobacter]